MEEIKLKIICGVSLVAIVLGGCQSVKMGPRALRASQSAYNRTVTMNMDEQLLENIVRLRYRDNPTFMEIASIGQASNISGNGSLGFQKGIMGGVYTGAISPNLTAGCGSSFNTNFLHLQGKDFVKKFMTPIQFSIVTSLIQSGWKLKRVFNLCVERVNNLYNAAEADGPTPEYAPEYKDFYRFSALLNSLDEKHLINFGEDPNANFSDYFMQIIPHPEAQSEITQLKKLAKLDPDKTLFKLKTDFIDQENSKLVIQCRTLMGVLFCLSQGIDVPQVDRDAGLVTITKDSDGTEFEWNDFRENFLAVQCSESKMRPANAYVACKYRGKWFYIADDDLNSKSTFLLVSQLLILQSANYKSAEPLLIIN